MVRGPRGAVPTAKYAVAVPRYSGRRSIWPWSRAGPRISRGPVVAITRTGNAVVAERLGVQLGEQRALGEVEVRDSERGRGIIGGGAPFLLAAVVAAGAQQEHARERHHQQQENPGEPSGHRCSVARAPSRDWAMSDTLDPRASRRPAPPAGPVHRSHGPGHRVRRPSGEPPPLPRELNKAAVAWLLLFVFWSVVWGWVFPHDRGADLDHRTRPGADGSGGRQPCVVAHADGCSGSTASALTGPTPIVGWITIVGGLVFRRLRHVVLLFASLFAVTGGWWPSSPTCMSPPARSFGPGPWG